MFNRKKIRELEYRIEATSERIDRGLRPKDIDLDYEICVLKSELKIQKKESEEKIRELQDKINHEESERSNEIEVIKKILEKMGYIIVSPSLPTWYNLSIYQIIDHFYGYIVYKKIDKKGKK